MSMVVSVEISLYPLGEDSNNAIDVFIKLLSKSKLLTVEPGKMSTIITGELSEIMETLSSSMEKVFEGGAAVFNLKISNCCPL